MARDTDRQLTLADLATHMGWTIKTARVMHYRATRNRAAKTPLPGDLPAPDHRYGQTPVWDQHTITAWQARRPGRGAGGGPKPRT